ncbi:hypothetical protein FOQG_02231 [Fusarium oxysporum f. sp. raphani 54005]|uniref:Ecp2 effector protein domain-containing protein n=4 Tax=Fusarium oxysporum TaxID=5507 RepID=X0DRB3_FUSOX|nr:hypothetical protein FOXB_04578 [Fusarium oxysporum f. sp. conglutinans Fo5176]EXA41839.1 hypothetical protein FOVG_07278 [Fusarium oxysporum f. sp. pisi HDV247]EXK96817.1 hypothetical protein FOQG_02231 [Fusarium oxysporum f. sp. raphani 54005]KAG6985127.1 hypothetical protein FocnCong_v004948 [Fusarium oxysporum f. sp. conglutinans]KAJ4038454.1 hypothetical protein NW758_009105 [Fusarium oxysporum]TVY76428.1 hypothetical protein Focb16_v006568 [Fusarium oxysporum f. sp. cubense]WKT40565.
MRLLLAFVSLLSLTTAGPVSRSPPDKDGEYLWGCGKTAPFSISDCNELLGWFKTVSKTGWFGIGKVNGLAKYWGSCQLYIQPGPLGHFALEIQQDEFVDVVHRGMVYKCPDKWARTTVKPDNNTWIAFVTEKGWEPHDDF